MSTEAIRDLRFDIPIKITPNRILSVKVFRQDDVTEQTDSTDFTIDKQRGEITLTDSGNWGTDTVFIARIEETGHGSFTNAVEVITEPKVGVSDGKPFLLVHSLPLVEEGIWNNNIAREFEENGVIRGEINQKFRMRVQIDLQAETKELMLLMYFELTRLGKVLHMPYFEWVYGERVQRGWIRLTVDPDIDPEWDYPRKTIDYKGFLQRQEFEDYPTTQNITQTITTDNEIVVTTGFEPPAEPSEILTFDDDIIYLAPSPKDSIEDSDWKMHFG